MTKLQRLDKSRFAERSRIGSTHGWQTLMPIRGCFRCHHHHEHHQEFYHHHCYHHHSHRHDNRPPSILQAQLVTFWWQTVGPRTVRLGAQFAKNITIIPGNDHYYLNHHNSSYRQSPNNAGEPEVQTVSLPPTKGVCLIILGTTSACKGGSPLSLVPAEVDHHHKCLQVASTTWHQHFLALEDPERRELLLLHSRHAQVGVVVVIAMVVVFILMTISRLPCYVFCICLLT